MHYSDTIDPERTEPWVLKLICCDHEDGYEYCSSYTEADQFRHDYLNAKGHDRSAVLSRAPWLMALRVDPAGPKELPTMLTAARQAWERSKLDHPPGASDTSDTVITLADDVMTEYAALFAKVREWVMENEIAAPPLDWRGLGVILAEADNG